MTDLDIAHSLQSPAVRIALALIVPALIAALFLPRVKPEPVEEDGEAPGADESAPVLMHV